MQLYLLLTLLTKIIANCDSLITDIVINETLKVDLLRYFFQNRLMNL